MSRKGKMQAFKCTSSGDSCMNVGHQPLIYRKSPEGTEQSGHERWVNHTNLSNLRGRQEKQPECQLLSWNVRHRKTRKRKKTVELMQPFFTRVRGSVLYVLYQDPRR